jgi:Fic family protein
MIISPSYQITPEILELISKIDSLRYFFSSIEIPQIIKDKIQRVSLLKSSLFSARIEGNPLQLNELDYTTETKKKKEITNIINSSKFIEKTINAKSILTKLFIKEIHQYVLKDLSIEAGCFRKEMGAIFNQAGIAIYISPPPEKISTLLDNLLLYSNSQTEKFPLINGIISHLIFEKIHPFIDGNGRVGRLLINAILRSKNYDLGMIIPFEEYIDNHKTDYYYHLDQGMSNCEEYLLFMLNAFYEETNKIKQQITDEMNNKTTVLLPPRQEEIFNIIKEHKVISFDFLQRRFLKVPARTLRYDLKKLKEKELIVKIGKTKGSYYQITS